MKNKYNMKSTLIAFLLLTLTVPVYLAEKAAAAGSITFTSATVAESVFSTVTASGKLNFSPALANDVTFSFSTNGECKLNGGGSYVTSGTFTAFGTNSSESVSVKAVDDNKIEGTHNCSVSYSTSSSDSNYNGKSGNMSFTIKDNDATPKFNLSKPSSVNEGKTTSFSVTSNDDPTHNITFTTSISGPCKLVQGGKGGSTLGKSFASTIYKGQANGPTYGIKSIDDNINPTPRCRVSFTTPSTSDPNYSGKTIPSFTVSVVDNDPVTTGSSSETTSSNSSESTEATSTSSAEPAAAPKENKPATESLRRLTINGEEFDPVKAEKKEFSQNEPITFSGKTIPNGIVTLYVFSEPKKYTATADKDGDWSIEVAGLPAGEHHAEVEVTDPKTKETSKRTKLLEFSVLGTSTEVAETVATATQKPSKTGTIIASVIGGLIAASLAAAGLAYRFKPEWFDKVKAKLHKTPPSSPTPPNDTPTPTSPQD